MTPEEIQQALLEAMQNMADVTKRQYEQQEKYYSDNKDLNEKIKKDKAASVETQQKYNKDIAKEAEARLGIEEVTNKGLKKTLDDRLDIEKKVVERVKKQMGEEAFIETQRTKFFRDQLEKYQQGTLAYGGVVTKFQDLDKQQQRAIVDGAKTQQRLQQEQEKFAKTVQMLANPGQAVGEMSAKFSTLGGALDAGKDSLIKLSGGGMAATMALELAAGAGKLIGAVFEGAAKAAMTMGKSLINGERGMSVGAKGVSAFTNSITGAVKAFGDLAIGIGAILIAIAPFTLGVSAVAGVALIAAGGVAKLGASAAEVAAELNEIAAALNDKLYAGFKELGQLSMTGARGMEGVIDNLHKMGLTVAEFDKFKTVITNNTKEMKMFGATAEQGVNKFASVAGALYKSEMGKALELMGISAEDQYEHTAKYLALQARLGKTEEQNAQNLARSTKAYIEELDTIAAITGASRKEQEQARDAVMKIEELRAAILDEQAKKEAGDKGADERIAKLQRGLDIATTYQQMGDAKMAKGAAEYAAAGGVRSQESAAFMNVAQRRGLMGMYEKGGASKEEMDLAARRAYIEQTQSMAGSSRYGANVGPLAGSAVVASEQKAMLAEYDKREKAEKARLGDKFSSKDLMDTIAKERKATDKSTEKNVEATRNQMDAAIKLDNAAFQYNKSVDINKLATDNFGKAVDLFAKAAGLKSDTQTATSPATSTGPLPLAETGGGAATGARLSMKRGGQHALDQSGRRSSGTDPRVAAMSSAPPEEENAGGGGPDAGGLKLTRVTSKSGKAASVNEKFAPAFQNLIDYLDKSGYDINSLGGYVDRDVRGMPGVKSIHAKGAAIDINPGSNPLGSKLVTDLPPDISQVAAGLGLGWGGDWKSRKDAMHFSAATSEGGSLLKAMNGGVFNGSSSGYPVELHGREAVVPLPNPDSIISVQSPTSPNKQPLSTVMNNTTSNSTDSSMLFNLMQMLSDKLDDVIDTLEDGNDTSSKILQYSQV